MSGLGEAKHRKIYDPYFGRIPKSGKGLIISSPMEIDGVSLFIRDSRLDPIELRRSVLFWDKLVWPENSAISFGDSIEADYLESLGVLDRPRFLVNGDVATGIAESFLSSFLKREDREPGQWAMSTGENALLLKSEEFTEARGASVELFRSIPIPEQDVPLEEVLRFKNRRLCEVRSLVVAIDEFYASWIAAEDKDHQLNLAKRKIEQACVDMLRVAKEDKNKFRLSNWKIGFGLNALGILGAAEIGGKIGQKFGFEDLGKLIGGTASVISLSNDIGFRKDPASSSPYKFAASLELETI